MTKRNPKKYPRRCRTPRCRGSVASKDCHTPYCSRCHNRRWKEKFPLHYSFKNLRVRAKQRGKDFTLTREQYIEFAIKTDYARMKGKTTLSLSIDRVNNSRGYHADNIAAITLRANSRKEHVLYFSRQMQNTNYEPTAEEIAAAEKAMAESEK
jgi:hypothetical protein